MNSLIRYATVTDIEQMAVVHLKSWKQVYKGIFSQSYLNQLTTQKWTEQFKKDILSKKIQYLIVAYNDKILGVIGFGTERFLNYAQSGEIYSFYVLPAYQNQTYGKQLLTQVISLMKSSYSKIFVRVVVENEKAYQFYVKNNFVDTRKIEVFELNGGKYKTNLLVIENKEIL